VEECVKMPQEAINLFPWLPEIAQSSISCQIACSSCSSQPAPGSAMAQLVQVPAGRTGAVLTLARTDMPGVSSTGARSGPSSSPSASADRRVPQTARCRARAGR
jgi:hypothetical protein